MSSRNVVAQSQSNRNFKVQPVTVTGRKAVLVQINWTTAPVIKTTVRRNCKISVLAIDTKNWTVIQRSMMNLSEGQVIHYTRSSEHPGYYYITILDESCTCTAGLYGRQCRHQKEVATLETSRTPQEQYVEATRQWQAAQERVVVNLVA